MGLAKNIMGAGFSPAQAAAVQLSAVRTALSAAGASQSGATALTADINLVSTVAAGAGVQLYNGVIGDSQFVYNDQATNGLVVYPPTSGTINQLTANTGMVLAPYTACEFFKVTSTRWVGVLSA